MVDDIKLEGIISAVRFTIGRIAPSSDYGATYLSEVFSLACCSLMELMSVLGAPDPPFDFFSFEEASVPSEGAEVDLT